MGEVVQRAQPLASLHQMSGPNIGYCERSVNCSVSSSLASAMRFPSNEIRKDKPAESANFRQGYFDGKDPKNYTSAPAVTMTEWRSRSNDSFRNLNDRGKLASLVSRRDGSIHQQMDTREEPSSDRVRLHPNMLSERPFSNHTDKTKTLDPIEHLDEIRRHEATCVCRRPAIGTMVRHRHDRTCLHI